MKPALRVAVTDAAGRRLGRGPAAGLGAWLARHAPAAARGTIAIAIVTDRQMRQMNLAHRGVNRATDVLSFAERPRESFPVKTETGVSVLPRNDSRGRFLGDIAIARGVAGRQARDAGHPIRTEFRVLALHGLLHLMGYDHDRDRGEMARVEERLRRRAGLPAGLIGRAGRPRSRKA